MESRRRSAFPARWSVSEASFAVALAAKAFVVVLCLIPLLGLSLRSLSLVFDLWYLLVGMKVVRPIPLVVDKNPQYNDPSFKCFRSLPQKPIRIDFRTWIAVGPHDLEDGTMGARDDEPRPLHVTGLVAPKSADGLPRR